MTEAAGQHFRLQLDKHFIPPMRQAAKEHAVAIKVIARQGQPFIDMGGRHWPPVEHGQIEIDVRGPINMDVFWQDVNARLRELHH